MAIVISAPVTASTSTRRHSMGRLRPRARCSIRGRASTTPQLFIDFTRRIIEGMGGSGPAVELAAREIYAEWAACHHFFLYDDVEDVLRDLHARGLKIGLISNSHRCLDFVPISLRARGAVFSGRYLRRTGLPETSPEHFRDGAASGGGRAVGIGDGGRQRGARRRRRTAPRHARRSPDAGQQR